MDRKGMTLIELIFICLAFFVLFSITMIGRYPDMHRAREASTKGNLGTLRSALASYFHDNKCYPARGRLTEKPFIGTTSENYIDEIPAAREDCKLYKEFHEKNKSKVEDVDLGGRGSENGGWAYFTPAGSTCPTVARICVNCAQLDSKGTVISTW